jgi:hypothetical protein
MDLFALRPNIKLFVRGSALMGKVIAVAAALVALGSIATSLASAGSAPAPHPSGVRGVVLDTSCAGPCIADQAPSPYTGPGLTVAVHQSGEVIKRLSPETGHFRTKLRPGLYRISASVEGNCWQGESVRTRVRRHRFSTLTLHVTNVCIVCVACVPCDPCPPCGPGIVCALPCPLDAARASQIICPL